MKKCSNKNCKHGNILQPLKNFRKTKRSKSGYSSWCKDCCKLHKSDNYYKRKLQLDTEYRKRNTQKIRDQKKEYYNTKCLFNSVSAQKLFSCQYEECKQDENNLELLLVKCTYCGSWFNPSNREVINRIRAINGTYLGESRIYCSENCKLACPTYRQRKYIKNYKKNTSREVNAILRKIVLERDNWECQKCGKNKDEVILHCHHIIPVIIDKIQSEDPDNCITLCKDCHNQVHLTNYNCSYNELKNICKKINKKI